MKQEKQNKFSHCDAMAHFIISQNNIFRRNRKKKGKFFKTKGVKGNTVGQQRPARRKKNKKTWWQQVDEHCKSAGTQGTQNSFIGRQHRKKKRNKTPPIFFWSTNDAKRENQREGNERVLAGPYQSLDQYLMMADMGNNHQRAWQHSIKSIKDEKKRRKQERKKKKKKRKSELVMYIIFYICGVRYNKEKLGALQARLFCSATTTTAAASSQKENSRLFLFLFFRST